ncbi:hypothetical protein CMUS01_01757 [Colletotrichum musicola]|uniref:Uncharacterized protein n=1 Tax=Colletotrichum musicola TaxID=2175873 RepID=A0A8H6NW66_9PEZI|nr:hypothetical protein CMUS01_01757 [Colletotrichum musicola]
MVAGSLGDSDSDGSDDGDNRDRGPPHKAPHDFALYPGVRSVTDWLMLSFLCAHLEQRQRQQQQCGGTEPRLPQNPGAGGDYSAVLSRTSPESGLWCWSGGGVSSNRVRAPTGGLQTAVSPGAHCVDFVLRRVARWFPFADERSTAEGDQGTGLGGTGTKDGPWRLRERGSEQYQYTTKCSPVK